MATHFVFLSNYLFRMSRKHRLEGLFYRRPNSPLAVDRRHGKVRANLRNPLRRGRQAVQGKFQGSARLELDCLPCRAIKESQMAWASRACGSRREWLRIITRDRLGGLF